MLGDTGLVCYPPSMDVEWLKITYSRSGTVLETFIRAEFNRQNTWGEIRPTLCVYCTCTQNVAGFALEEAAGRLVGTEMKKSASLPTCDLKGLRNFR